MLLAVVAATLIANLINMPNKKKLVDITHLTTVLNYVHPINDGIKDYLQKHCFICTFKKGKHILKAGQVSTYLYFIVKGIARGYMKESNRDITTWITSENEFITSISGFHLQTAAIENIQAIEDCELIGLSYSSLEKLYKLFPEYNILVRKFYQHYYLDAEKRALIARLKNAENKYHYFLELHSHLVNRVPLKYIASYLGINLETLSRVRKKMSKV